MGRVVILALALASCGPDGSATPGATTEGSSAASTSESTTLDASPETSSGDSTTTTGEGADACAAPLACGDDCLQWEWVLQTFGDDELVDVALAPGGTIFAVGKHAAQGDATLVALAADGGEIFTETLLHGLGDADNRFASGVAVASDGRVAVLGQLGETPHVIATMVVELRGSDGELAQQVLEEGCRADALAFADDGSLWVAGVCDGAGTLRKYDAALALVWETHDLPAGLFAVELLAPIGDEMIVGGVSSDWLGLARLGPDGAQVWRVKTRASTHDLLLLGDLAVLPSGDVIAVGFAGQLGASRWAARVDGESGVRWSKTLASPPGELYGLVGAAVDASGRIFVTGDADLVELDGDGEIVGCWEHEAPDGSGLPKARALAASAEVGVIVVGSGYRDVDRYASVVRVVP